MSLWLGIFASIYTDTQNETTTLKEDKYPMLKFSVRKSGSNI